jgi:hypothetical protein
MLKCCRKLLDGCAATSGQPGEEVVRPADEIDESRIGFSLVGPVDNDPGLDPSSPERHRPLNRTVPAIIIVAGLPLIRIAAF